MKFSSAFVPWLIAAGSASAQTASQFPPQIKNIVVIVQENRTPDFHEAWG